MNQDITIHQGSILDCNVDAIVNPANSFLNNGGGLARVIHQAAKGPGSATIRRDAALEGKNRELAQLGVDYVDEVESAPLIPYGGAILTGPGLLAERGLKGIIHAVGPIWGGGTYCERELLSSAYSHALLRALEAGYDSIAFPAISAGIFGVPIEVVAKEAVMQASWTQLRVEFALMDDDHVSAFRAELLDRRVWKPAAR